MALSSSWRMAPIPTIRRRSTPRRRARSSAPASCCARNWVVLETDPATARSAAREAISRYMQLENYVNGWRRQGFGEISPAGAPSGFSMPWWRGATKKQSAPASTNTGRPGPTMSAFSRSAPRAPAKSAPIEHSTCWRRPGDLDGFRPAADIVGVDLRLGRDRDRAGRKIEDKGDVFGNHQIDHSHASSRSISRTNPRRPMIVTSGPIMFGSRTAAGRRCTAQPPLADHRQPRASAGSARRRAWSASSRCSLPARASNIPAAHPCRLRPASWSAAMRWKLEAAKTSGSRSPPSRSTAPISRSG